MFSLNALRLAKDIVTTSAAFGAKLPAPVTTAYERARRIVDAAIHVHPGPDALTLAVLAALDKGVDPATDAGVQRAYLLTQVGNLGISKGIEEIVSGQMLEAFRDNADAIVTAWAKPFDKAAATLATCLVRIGNRPLDDTGPILAAGGDIAEVWAKATQAAAVCDQLGQAWQDLATFTRFVSVTPQTKAVRFATGTAEQWYAGTHEDVAPGIVRDVPTNHLTAWDALRAGLDLSLATSRDYTQRATLLRDAIAAEAVPA